MSLEQQVAGLSQNLAEITGEFRGIYQQHEAARTQMIGQVNAFINNFAYREATTFEVGAGKPYSSINQVLNLLKDKVLTAPVLIKVSDGIHDYKSIEIYRHPYAHKIRIEGNVANPANCVIRWIPDAAGNSHGIIINGCSGINISGFKFLGSSTESNWTYRSIFVGDKSSFYSDDNSLMVEGGVSGLELYDYAQIHAPRLRLSNIAGTAMLFARLASGWIPNAVISGAGKNASVTIPSRHNGGALNPRGIWLMDNTNVRTAGAVISNLRYGLIAERGAHTEASLIDVSGCNYGILATLGGVINAWSSNDGLTKPKVRSCDYGLIVDHGSSAHFDKGVAENCSAAGMSAINGGVLLASGGYATGCGIGYKSAGGGLLTAHGVAANSSGNTVNYDVDENSTLIWS